MWHAFDQLRANALTARLQDRAPQEVEAAAGAEGMQALTEEVAALLVNKTCVVQHVSSLWGRLTAESNRKSDNARAYEKYMTLCAKSVCTLANGKVNTARMVEHGATTILKSAAMLTKNLELKGACTAALRNLLSVTRCMIQNRNLAAVNQEKLRKASLQPHAGHNPGQAFPRYAATVVLTEISGQHPKTRPFARFPG